MDYDNAFGVSGSRSVTGGYVYRGGALGAAFRGRYFYADEVSGKIASVRLTVDPVTRLATASDFRDHTAEFASRGNITSIDIDANGEIYVVMYGGEIRRLCRSTADPDGDGMTTEAELRYGLEPDSAAGVNGAAGDPDGDGVTNAAEIAAGTHPRGFDAFTRQLAEGAELGVLRDQRVADEPRQRARQRGAAVPQGHRDDGDVAGDDRAAAAPDDQPWPARGGEQFVVRDDHRGRPRSGGRADDEVGQEQLRRPHREGDPRPGHNWFFAEGSQGFFLTYLLLTNPSTSQNRASIRFLRETGAPIVQEFALAPLSRRTVFCGSIAGLVNTSFGIEVTFLDAPGAAERAMYLGLPPDQLFKAGHESAGVTAPATDWFLAEGATGVFFETFVLVANPNPSVADVTLTFVTESGVHGDPQQDGSRQRPPHGGHRGARARRRSTTPPWRRACSRTSRWWWSGRRTWPFAPPFWYEAHNSFGVPAARTHWGLAEGQTGRFESADTFILLANNTNTAATVTIDFIREADIPLRKTFTVPANSRFSVAAGLGNAVPELHDERFGAIVTSTVPIVVERALYWNANSEFWSAGTDATATELLP